MKWETTNLKMKLGQLQEEISKASFTSIILETDQRKTYPSWG